MITESALSLREFLLPPAAHVRLLGDVESSPPPPNSGTTGEQRPTTFQTGFVYIADVSDVREVTACDLNNEEFSEAAMPRFEPLQRRIVRAKIATRREWTPAPYEVDRD